MAVNGVSLALMTSWNLKAFLDKDQISADRYTGASQH
jgi:hypothetical protein